MLEVVCGEDDLDVRNGLKCTLQKLAENDGEICHHHLDGAGGSSLFSKSLHESLQPKVGRSIENIFSAIEMFSNRKKLQ